MSLLISPIDGSPMRQIHRYGIEIDVCPTSGGVWLDRGELEKIIQLLQDDAAENMTQARSHARHESRYRGRDDDDDDDDRRYHSKGYYGSGKYHKKDSKMSRIMDLFDF